MVNPKALEIAEAVRAAGGRALVVGGWVRDRLLGRESKDVDLEVFGVPADALRALLGAGNGTAPMGSLSSAMRGHKKCKGGTWCDCQHKEPVTGG